MIGPRYTVERGESHSWIVCKDGKQVHGPSPTRDLAENARDRLEREAKYVERKCMTCGTPFISTGPGHRMCGRCRRGDGPLLD